MFTATGHYRIKDIFIHNANWWFFFLGYWHMIREDIVEVVIKMLSCKTKLRGYKKHRCPKCNYTVTVPHTCKSRFCSSCGKKSTQLWIDYNFDELPATEWQHITFTMPDIFWDFFWLNRYLLNLIPAIAASVVQDLGKKKGVEVGIFLMLHTFGRDLKRNIHIHLSATTGGLSLDYKDWKKVSFSYKAMMRMWRKRIISMFRDEFLAGRLTLPPQLQHLSQYPDFNRLLDQNYQKNWNVHASKPTKDHTKNVNYLARYLKRPPLADTRIEYYDGEVVTFNFLDHHTGKHDRKTVTVPEFIARLIQHIPDKHFRLIRYYGWLSNRTRNIMLPIVRKMLKLKESIQKFKSTFESMMKTEFNCDILTCPFCKIAMHCVAFISGEKLEVILANHKRLALPVGMPI